MLLKTRSQRVESIQQAVPWCTRFADPALRADAVAETAHPVRPRQSARRADVTAEYRAGIGDSAGKTPVAPGLGIRDSGSGTGSPGSGIRELCAVNSVLFGMDRYRSLSAAALVAIALPLAACNVDVRKHEVDGKADVDITTPVGNVSVRTNVDKADTGLAVYPNARPLEEEDEPKRPTSMWVTRCSASRSSRPSSKAMTRRNASSTSIATN